MHDPALAIPTFRLDHHNPIRKAFPISEVSDREWALKGLIELSRHRRQDFVGTGINLRHVQHGQWSIDDRDYLLRHEYSLRFFNRDLTCDR